MQVPRKKALKRAEVWRGGSRAQPLLPAVTVMHTTALLGCVEPPLSPLMLHVCTAECCQPPALLLTETHSAVVGSPLTGGAKAGLGFDHLLPAVALVFFLAEIPNSSQENLAVLALSHSEFAHVDVVWWIANRFMKFT